MYYEKPKSLIEFERKQSQIVVLDWLVPQDHILRKIDEVVDFSFIHELTKDKYSSDNGRPCLDTVILFKIPLLNFIMGKNSIRATLEEANVNMAYRWFLDIGLDKPIPNYSTFSQNYRRRYADSNVFEKIFTYIVTRIAENGLIDESIIFVDGTHIKANANKHKEIRKRVRVIADEYHKQLEKEIDEFRELNGRDKYHNDNNDDDNDDDDDSNGDTYVDQETGEVLNDTNNKTENVEEYTYKTVSTTDPDCGMFVKGEHERQFAYVDQVACDKNGWVLAYNVNPGNVHDSKAFLPFFYNDLLKFNVKTICADAGYISGLISYNVQSNGINMLTPYAAPKGRNSVFSKKLFDYYMEIDSYICPNHKLLIPWNITKDGFIQYRISKKECGNCIYKTECLKKANQKVINRNIYQDCLDKGREYRLSDEGKAIYKHRQETIERVFAEGKEKHCLRYTRYKGLKKNKDMRALLYACLNIKKLANYVDKLANLKKNNNLCIE